MVVNAELKLCEGKVVLHWTDKEGTLYMSKEEIQCGGAEGVIFAANRLLAAMCGVAPKMQEDEK